MVQLLVLQIKKVVRSSFGIASSSSASFTFRNFSFRAWRLFGPWISSSSLSSSRKILLEPDSVEKVDPGVEGVLEGSLSESGVIVKPSISDG